MEHVGNFGDWLKQARKELDLSQRDLAKQVSCALVTIQKIEAGRRRPSQQLSGLLARCLAISPEDTERFLKLARCPAVTKQPIRGETDPPPDLTGSLPAPAPEVASRLGDHSISPERVRVGQPLGNWPPVVDFTDLIELYRLEANALFVMGNKDAAVTAADLATSLEASAQLHSRLILLLAGAGIAPTVV